jgi:hypothetical protein
MARLTNDTINQFVKIGVKAKHASKKEIRCEQPALPHRRELLLL